MTDIQIEFPEKYHFSTELSIRKTDLALDIHVSFASILDLVMEAHLQFFQYLGFSVTDIYGKSIIFANAGILYQGELLYKDQVKIDVVLDNLGEKSFDLTFRLSKDQRKEKVALIKIRVLFFDYSIRRVVSVPEGFRKIFTEEKFQYILLLKLKWFRRRVLFEVKVLINWRFCVLHTVLLSNYTGLEIKLK